MRRCAFTLTELLIVVAIIGVVVACSMPAIQMARRAAGGIACANIMRPCGAGHFG